MYQEPLNKRTITFAVIDKWHNVEINSEKSMCNLFIIEYFCVMVDKIGNVFSPFICM